MVYNSLCICLLSLNDNFFATSPALLCPSGVSVRCCALPPDERPMTSHPRASSVRRLRLIVPLSLCSVFTSSSWLLTIKLLVQSRQTLRGHGSPPHGWESVHSVSPLLHRAPLRVVCVFRGACAGKTTRCAVRFAVRTAPHTGHSTCAIAECARRRASTSSAPDPRHFVGGAGWSMVPTGSRWGRRWPTRGLAGG